MNAKKTDIFFLIASVIIFILTFIISKQVTEVKINYFFCIIIMFICICIILRSVFILYRDRKRCYNGHFYYRKSPRTGRVYIYIEEIPENVNKVKVSGDGGCWQEISIGQIMVRDNDNIYVELKNGEEFSFRYLYGKFS